MSLFQVFFLFIYLLTQSPLEGTWKLKDFSGFDSLMRSRAFEELSEAKKLDAIQGMEFVLENTVYSFHKDSVFFTNAGPDFSVSEKNGRFLVKSDTLIVFEFGKVNPIKFFISSLSESELKLRFVVKDGGLGPTLMTFERVRE